MQDIKELTRDELAKWFEAHNMKSFRAGQVFKWIYLRQADTFDDMTDLAKDARALLNEHFYIPRLEIESTEFSADGTEKSFLNLQTTTILKLCLSRKKITLLCASHHRLDVPKGVDSALLQKGIRPKLNLCRNNIPS